MLKRILPIAFLIVLLLVCIAACTPTTNNDADDKAVEPHDHKGGVATCTKRATCEICKEPYGEKAEHDYSEATCTAPEVCKICRHTRGEKVDHDYLAATCKSPATCRFCGTTNGSALGHDLGNVKYDSGYHWYECGRCGQKLDYEGHRGGQSTCTSSAKSHILSS